MNVALEFTWDMFVNSPSRKDHITERLERHYRCVGATFIEKLSNNVSTSGPIRLRAMSYFQQFYMRSSFARKDRWEVAVACLLLACKVLNFRLSIEDAVKKAMAILYEKEVDTNESADRIHFWMKVIHDRETDIMCRLHGELCVIDCSKNLKIKSFTKLIKQANGEAIDAQQSKDIWKQSMVNAVAGYRSIICLFYPPPWLTAAALHLTIRTRNDAHRQYELIDGWFRDAQFHPTIDEQTQITQETIEYLEDEILACMKIEDACGVNFARVGYYYERPAKVGVTDRSEPIVHQVSKAYKGLANGHSTSAHNESRRDPSNIEQLSPSPPLPLKRGQSTPSTVLNAAIAEFNKQSMAAAETPPTIKAQRNAAQQHNRDDSSMTSSISPNITSTATTNTLSRPVIDNTSTVSSTHDTSQLSATPISKVSSQSRIKKAFNNCFYISNLHEKVDVHSLHDFCRRSLGPIEKIHFLDHPPQHNTNSNNSHSSSSSSGTSTKRPNTRAALVQFSRTYDVNTVKNFNLGRLYKMTPKIRAATAHEASLLRSHDAVNKARNMSTSFQTRNSNRKRLFRDVDDVNPNLNSNVTATAAATAANTNTNADTQIQSAAAAVVSDDGSTAVVVSGVDEPPNAKRRRRQTLPEMNGNVPLSSSTTTSLSDANQRT